MSRNTIILILAVVSLSLLGLSIVQIKWIREAISVKEEQFDQNVYTALRQVVRQVELKDMQDRLKWMNEPLPMSMDQRRQLKNRIIHIPTSGEMRFEVESVVHGTEQNNENVASFHRQERIYVNSSENGAVERIEVRGPELNNEMVILVDSLTGRAIEIDTIQVYQMIDEQTEHIKNIFYEKLFSPKTLAERIDSTELNTWLNKSLQNNGIKTEVQYALFSPQHEIIYKACEEDPSYVLQSPYAVNLYAQDPFAEKGTLFVYFPKQQRYLLSSMGLMLGSSGIFILMLLGSFLILAQTIFRQKKLSEMKTDFINNMTHELKTPVATISLASEMLKNDKVNDEQSAVKRYAEIIFKENKRLGTQVERVLQLSRLDKGDITLNIEMLDVNELVEDVVGLFKLQLDDADATVALDINNAPIHIHGDQMHLTNVIGNLIDNAIKYCSQKSHIIIRTFEKKDKVIIEVEDNGIGMSREVRGRIFDKFYRASQGDKHDVKGFGLGLSYVKKIMDAHDAEVIVSSEVGRGSIFEMIFIKQTT